MAIEWIAEQMRSQQLDKANQAFTEAAQLSGGGEIEQAENLARGANNALSAAKEITILTKDYLSKLKEIGAEQPPLSFLLNHSLLDSNAQNKHEITERKERRRRPITESEFIFPDGYKLNGVPGLELLTIKTLPFLIEEAISKKEIAKLLYPYREDTKTAEATVGTRLCYLKKVLIPSQWRIARIIEGKDVTPKYYLSKESDSVFIFPDGKEIRGFFNKDMMILQALPFDPRAAISLSSFSEIIHGDKKSDNPLESTYRCLWRLNTLLRGSNWKIVKVKGEKGWNKRYYIERISKNDSTISREELLLNSARGGKGTLKDNNLLLSQGELSLIARCFTDTNETERKKAGIYITDADRIEARSLIDNLGLSKSDQLDKESNAVSLVIKLSGFRKQLLETYSKDEGILFLLSLLGNRSEEELKILFDN